MKKMEKTVITLPPKKGLLEKPWTCDLCGEKDEDVTMYCGGYVMFAHPKCGEIGNEAIRRHLRRMAYSTHSLEFLVQEFHEIYKKENDLKDEGKMVE